jgi:hypothetical protein
VSLSNIDDKYDYSNVEFPMSFDDITSFEENNQVMYFCLLYR